MAHPGKPPQFWTKQEVRSWLTWCIDEYALDLSESHLDSFQMNGKALLMLKREDFCRRAPSRGDVIYNALQQLVCQSPATSPVTSHPVPREVLDDSLLWTNIPMTSSSCLSRDCYPDSHWDDDKDDVSGPGVTSAGGLNCFPQDLSHVEYAANVNTRKRPYMNIEPTINEVAVLPLKKRCLRNRGRARIDDFDGEDSSSIYSSKTSDINWPSDDTDVCTADGTIVKDDQALLLDLSTPEYNPAPDEKSASGTEYDGVSPFAEVCPFVEDSSVQDERTPDCNTDSRRGSDVTNDPDTELDVTANVKDEASRNSESPSPSKQIPNGQNKLLWEFISELLEEPSRDKPVRWLDQSTLTFRISDPAMLAGMWGDQKRKGNMTYEKLSRALRYYYKMKIISKVPGKKLTYRYLTPPPNIIKGVRGAKPGVPHKRRKHREPNPATLQDAVPEILDLSIKKHKKSAKTKSTSKSVSSTVTSASGRTRK